MKWTVAVVALAAAAVAAALIVRGRLAARETAQEAVAYVRPELRTIAATVTTTGVIRLRVGAEVRVGSQVSGIVKKLNVTVGSHIRRDDIIAEIDSRSLEAQLAQARAQVAVAEQAVERADVDLRRAQQLGAAGVVPRQQVEDATLAVQAAHAQLEKNRRDADVVATDLSYAVIRAPISGTVASVSTQEGETVAAAFAAPTFVTIIADRALQLIAMVDETDIANVARGNPVTFTVEAYPAREFRGRVERIAPKATIVSGVVNYEVMVDIDSAADVLKPDMTANISVKTAERRALVIPNAALQREGEQRFVLVDQSGHLIKRVVSVGVREAGVVEIKTGLATSDRILASAPAPKG
ncbi:MAG: efflux RND transporter periplasmic adaptor subunit [Vicinamibacterales bacterium]